MFKLQSVLVNTRCSCAEPVCASEMDFLRGAEVRQRAD